jgi:hypothetical protein
MEALGLLAGVSEVRRMFAAGFTVLVAIVQIGRVTDLPLDVRSGTPIA